MSKPNLGVESHPFRLSELVSALLKTDCCHTLIMAMASLWLWPVLKGRWRALPCPTASSEGKMEVPNLVDGQF